MSCNGHNSPYLEPYMYATCANSIVILQEQQLCDSNAISLQLLL